jgi:hypothetical protein
MNGDKIYAAFLVVMILGLAFLVLVVIGFCIREIFKKNKPTPEEITKELSKPGLYKKIETLEELQSYKGIRGDMIFVTREEKLFYYDGERWVKVDKSGYGDKRKETGESL